MPDRWVHAHFYLPNKSTIEFMIWPATRTSSSTTQRSDAVILVFLLPCVGRKPYNNYDGLRPRLASSIRLPLSVGEVWERN